MEPRNLYGNADIITLKSHRLLRKIFGSKRDEETGERRKLYNVEPHNLYGNADIIRTLKSHRL